MRHRLPCPLLSLGFFALPSCGVRVLVHDEQAAARTAARFADLAFDRSDYAGARALLSPQMQQALPTDKLAAEVARMHPKARPSEGVATEFEPLPGQQAMGIYLKGRGMTRRSSIASSWSGIRGRARALHECVAHRRSPSPHPSPRGRGERATVFPHRRAFPAGQRRPPSPSPRRGEGARRADEGVPVCATQL